VGTELAARDVDASDLRLRYKLLADYDDHRARSGLPMKRLLLIATIFGLAPLACSDESLQLPDCVSALIASCAPQGACVYSDTSATISMPDVCFASGVQAALRQTDGPGACGGFVKVVQVAKADGTPCYSFESYVDSGMQCEGERFTWKDASGVVVATGLTNGYLTPRTKITCAATSEVRSCGRETSGGGASDGCCSIDDFGAASCAPPVGAGTCTAGACALSAGGAR
jgi:hypothetical protein